MREEQARARLQPVTMLKKSCEGYFQVRVDIHPVAGPHKPIKSDIETILAAGQRRLCTYMYLKPSTYVDSKKIDENARTACKARMHLE